VARIEKVLAGDETWGAYALDVAGHAGLGTAYALPFVASCLYFGTSTWLALVVGLVAALAGGVAREVVQYLGNRKLHLFDRVLDALHHLLGAPIALALVYLVLYLIA
jgi:hypothetical protein